MLYLLDSNVLIRAHEDYYPLDRMAPFWDWLIQQAEAGNVKMPFEIHDEIAQGRGPLKDWIVNQVVRDALILNEEVDQETFNRVLDTAYAPDLSDVELEEVGRDPFLIAYALMAEERTVVTKEVSKPGKRRGRRKVPDACDDLEIPWITDFGFYRELDFRIR